MTMTDLDAIMARQGSCRRQRAELSRAADTLIFDDVPALVEEIRAFAAECIELDAASNKLLSRHQVYVNERHKLRRIASLAASLISEAKIAEWVPCYNVGVELKALLKELGL